MGGAGKTWYASIASSGLVQIPDITGGVGVDMVRQRRGLGSQPQWERKYVCVGRCVLGGKCTCVLGLMNMTYE